MNTFILFVGVSAVPALTGIFATLPLWKTRLKNDDIRIVGIVVLITTLICTICYTAYVTSLGENWITGFLCMLLSGLNLPIFRLYDRLLHLTRCPHCHRCSLHVTNVSASGHYKVHCRHCGIHTDWRN